MHFIKLLVIPKLLIIKLWRSNGQCSEGTRNNHGRCSERTTRRGNAPDRDRSHREGRYRTCNKILVFGPIWSAKRGINLLALVSVPVIGLGVHALVLVGVHQLIPVVHAHTSTDDLTNTGHEHVDTLGDAAVLGVLLHVECFDLGREVGQEDRLVNDVGHTTLSSLGNIVAELVGLALLVGDFVLDQPLDSIVVLHATEGTGWGLEIGVELLDVAGDLGLGENVVNDTCRSSPRGGRADR